MKIITVKEHESVPIEVDMLVKSGALLIPKEISEMGVFKISSKGGGIITFSAGAFVGCFRLSPDITVVVKPRFPISNLLRILALGDEKYKVLTEHTHYEHEGEWDTIIDIYADAFIKAFSSIEAGGVLKQYSEVYSKSSSPKGAICMGRTISQSRSRGRNFEIVDRHFIHSIDNPQNRLIKSAAFRFINYYSNSKNKNQALLRKSSNISRHLSGADIIRSSLRLSSFLRSSIRDLPRNRRYYKSILQCSAAILSGRGINIMGIGDDVSLPSLSIKLDEAFEAYIRNCLILLSEKHKEIRVLNGNISPPTGGSRHLFDRGLPSGIGYKNEANPDIIVKYNDLPMVIDVKYKNKSDNAAPEREDLNQFISYCSIYQYIYGIIICPSREGDGVGMTFIGNIGDVRIYVYRIFLGSSTILHQEESLRNSIAALAMQM